MMRTINFNDQKVLDLGTGTGVLAILAEQLGADYISAIDHDDWSISNAAENFVTNRCRKISLKKADSIIQENLYDIILANINKDVLLSNMSHLRQHLLPGGVVVMSGFLTGDEGRIKAEALNDNLGIRAN